MLRARHFFPSMFFSIFWYPTRLPLIDFGSLSRFRISHLLHFHSWVHTHFILFSLQFSCNPPFIFFFVVSLSHSRSTLRFRNLVSPIHSALPRFSVKRHTQHFHLICSHRRTDHSVSFTQFIQIRSNTSFNSVQFVHSIQFILFVRFSPLRSFSSRPRSLVRPLPPVPHSAW